LFQRAWTIAMRRDEPSCLTVGADGPLIELIVVLVQSWFVVL
jgi:hypothetical protein